MIFARACMASGAGSGGDSGGYPCLPRRFHGFFTARETRSRASSTKWFFFNAPLFLLFDNAGLRLARILRRLQQLPRVARLHELVHGHVAACTMSLSMSYKCSDGAGGAAISSASAPAEYADEADTSERRGILLVIERHQPQYYLSSGRRSAGVTHNNNNGLMADFGKVGVVSHFDSIQMVFTFFLLFVSLSRTTDLTTR